jgi:hypothetical protein
MANAGRVEVTITAVGEDKLSAMLAKVNANMETTKSTIDRTAAASRNAAVSTGTFADSIKSSIKPLDGLRGAVDMVRSNIGFLAGGFIGLGSTLVALATDFLTVKEEIDATAGKMFKAAGEAAELARELGRASAAANTAALSTQGFGVRVADLGAQIARLRGDTKLAETFEQQSKILGTLGKVAALEAELEKTDVLANEQLAKVYKLRTQERDLRTQVAVLGATIAKTEAESGLVNERLRSQLGAATLQLGVVAVNTQLAETTFRKAARSASEFAQELVLLDELAMAQANPAATPSTARPTGGRPVERLPGSQILSTDLDVMAQLEDSFAGITIAEREFIDLSGMFGKALRDDVVQGFRDIRDEGLSAAEAIISVSAALNDSMTAAFPDIGKGLGEVTLHMQRYRDELEKLDEQVRLGADAAAAQQKATDSLTMAVIGSGTAIAASVAKTLGGLQLEYAVRSAGEFAAGVATSFTNPAESAAHFGASVLYGIAAAKAGGSGGGGARGGGGGGSGGTGGGPAKTKASEGGVIVYNFNQLTAEGFGVKKAVRQLNARRDRSGYAQRAGV